MNENPFQCGCERGYREVITGTLKDYAASPNGVGLAIAMDPCGEAFMGCDKDEAWAKATLGKHLVVTITQFPKQGPKVVDIGILEGRASELAKKAAWLSLVMGVQVLKVGDGQWNVRIPKGTIPDGHPILEELNGQDVIPLTDNELDGLEIKLQELKRQHESGQR